MEKTVAHLTSVHPRYDTRIFVKMCSSLARNAYRVSLVVADGEGDSSRNNIDILDVGVSEGRLTRMLKTTRRIFKKAKLLDCDIYHLHDPELIPVGLKLKRLGKKVIFDAHEDYPKQLLGKPYLNPRTKIILSKAFALYERRVCGKFDAVITATPFIRDKFLQINPNTVDINNFPLLHELSNSGNWSYKQNEVAYVGGISKIRGIQEMVQAMALTQGVRLNLAGKFSEPTVEIEMKQYEAWLKVNQLGLLSRQRIKEVLSKSIAGLVTLLPAPNYLDALPVKMFEYMSAGLPVIASDFPLWREIVEENQCGLCVDPLHPKAIGEAIQYVTDHPGEAKQMGENGRKAVTEKYNWPIEEEKLLTLYKELLN